MIIQEIEILELVIPVVRFSLRAVVGIWMGILNNKEVRVLLGKVMAPAEMLPEGSTKVPLLNRFQLPCSIDQDYWLKPSQLQGLFISLADA
ncbi:hypothetical protein WH7805_11908 [Synechococcus sp. WH 7805]|nr:hypothetical protein WH7805_11908 [Synechococcus sp. WH 7805]